MSRPPRWAGKGKLPWLGHTDRLRSPLGTRQGKHLPDCMCTLEKEGPLLHQTIIETADGQSELFTKPML